MIDFKYLFDFLYNFRDWLGLDLDFSFNFFFKPPWWPPA